MEDNNKGPYEYEKPLRSKQSKRLRIATGLGLFGIGTVLSSSAIGANLFPTSPTETSNPNAADGNFIPSGDNGEGVSDSTFSSSLGISQNIGIPVALVGNDGKGKHSLTLPALPGADYSNSSNATQAAGHSNGSGSGAGNVSSPTPSAGSGSGSGGGSGNVSSPTPSAGSGSGSGGGSGNVSSPTPSGGSSSNEGSDDGDSEDGEYEGAEHEGGEHESDEHESGEHEDIGDDD